MFSWQLCKFVERNSKKGVGSNFPIKTLVAPRSYFKNCLIQSFTERTILYLTVNKSTCESCPARSKTPGYGPSFVKVILAESNLSR